MSKLRNEQNWIEVESLPVFAEKPENPELHEKFNLMWQFLENLEKENVLNSMNILRVQTLIDYAYDLGIEKGKSEMFHLSEQIEWNRK